MKQQAMTSCCPPKRKKKPPSITYKNTRKQNNKKPDFYFRFKHHAQSGTKRVLCSDQALTEPSSMSCYQQPTKKYKTRNNYSCIFDHLSSNDSTFEINSPANSTTLPLANISLENMTRKLEYHIKPLFVKEKKMWRSKVK